MTSAPGLALILVLAACSAAPPEAPRLVFGGETRPVLADAYSDYLVGGFAALTNDPREATARYTDALSTPAPDGEVAARGVYAALLAGDVDAATRFAARAEASGETAFALQRITLAVAAIRRDRPVEAVSILEVGPFDPFSAAIAHQLRAWCRLETEGLEAALADLAGLEGSDRASRLMRDYTEAMLLLSAGERGRALARLQAMEADGHDLALAAEMHARLLAADGERARAADLLNAFMADVGSNPALKALEVDIRAGRPVDDRAPSFRRATAQAAYLPAVALSARSDSDLPNAYFALALALDPDFTMARVLWADALDRAGRRAEAIALLETVPERSPYFATARGQMAWVLLRTGDEAAALETASDALARTSDRDLKIQFGDLLTTVDRHGQAVEVFSELIAEDARAGKTDWRLLFARGAALEALGRWPEAELDLTRAVSLAPHAPELLNFLGYAWVERGDRLEEGLELLRSANRLKPNTGHILDSVGWAYLKLGKTDMAIAYLERAVEAAPDLAVVNHHLGDAYWTAGRWREARFQWERALKLDPGTGDAATLREKLASGLPGDMKPRAVSVSVPPVPNRNASP